MQGMSKAEFMYRLESRISHLPPAEIQKSLNFYSECIDDRIEEGMTEEEAVAQLGDIEKIANGIESEMSIPKIVKSRIVKSQRESKYKGLWIALAILGSPFWVPILIALLALIFSLYVAAWAVIISIWAVFVYIGTAGVAGLAASLYGIPEYGAGAGLMLFGASVAGVGLFLVILPLLIFIPKKFVQLTIEAIKKLKNIIVSKEAPQ